MSFKLTSGQQAAGEIHSPGKESIEMEQQNSGNDSFEVDISEFAARGEAVPDAKVYKARIDHNVVAVDTRYPTGEILLAKVGKRPCAFELIAEFAHRENDVIEPSEEIDLRQHGLKGFITAHKEIVQISIDGNPYSLERGNQSVAGLLGKVGKAPDAYMLLEEKNGPPLPLSPNLPVKIEGCEVFYTQVQTGGSS